MHKARPLMPRIRSCSPIHKESRDPTFNNALGKFHYLGQQPKTK